MENMLYFVIITDVNNEGVAIDTNIMHMDEKIFRMWRFMYDAGILDTTNHSYTFINPKTTIIDLTRNSQN